MHRIITALFCLLILTTPVWCAAADTTENVVIPRSELEAIKARLSEMEREIGELKAQLNGQTIEEAHTHDEFYEDEHAEEIEHAHGEEHICHDPHFGTVDLSVFGDFVGRVTSDGFDDTNGDNLFLREIEVGFHGHLWPDVTADVILAMENEDGLNTTLEEGYISFLGIGSTNFNSQLGKMRLDFGKVNKLHPHEWYYVTPPLAVRNFLTDHGLLVNGASLSYVAPSRNRLLPNIDVGIWSLSNHGHEGEDHEAEEHDEFGLGFKDRIYSGRLWTNRILSEKSQLQLGASVAHGPGADEEFVLSGDSDRVTLSGLDLTYMLHPAPHKRFMLQSEFIQQRRANQNHFGYYALVNYQWNECWDLGLRYDWSERPVPHLGHDSGVSAILTNYLSDTTKLRLQYTHGNSAEEGSVNEGFLQVIWGLGSHNHSLD